MAEENQARQSSKKQKDSPHLLGRGGKFATGSSRVPSRLHSSAFSRCSCFFEPMPKVPTALGN